MFEYDVFKPMFLLGILFVITHVQQEWDTIRKE
jgi:hypothetical protein